MTKLLTLQSLALATLSLTALALLMAAAPATPAPAAGAAPRIKLYPSTPNVIAGTDTDANPTEPTLDIYLPPADKATGAAILILPGGAYANLSMKNEGSDEAQFFQSHNVAAFVLRYRHGPRYHYPTTLLDAQRAVRLVRSSAAEYHLNPDKIGIMGFSAGGSLAALTSTLFDNKLLPEAPYTSDAVDALSAKPNFSILLYPVIDLTDDTLTHKGSRTNLTQDNKDLYAPLSPQLHVTKDTPPAFLVHGTNDRTVPVMNSLLYYQALLKAGVPAEMHILENGPHGFGMSLTGANSTDEAIRAWPDQALRWMARHKLLTP